MRAVVLLKRFRLQIRLIGNPPKIANRILLIASLLLAAQACIEPYVPKVADQDQSILVIDGFLDTSNKTALVRLSHTISTYASSNDHGPEVSALVAIESDDGVMQGLSSLGDGTFTLNDISIDPAHQYRLYVETSDHSRFVSDLISVNDGPAIDSVTWSADEKGVTIMVNTHDPTGRSRYYRWEYIETWKYHAAVASDFKLIDRMPVYRTDAERIYYCWRTRRSTEILIGNSARLADDIIYQQPVTFLPKGSSQITTRYSILVLQRAIDKEEYTYLEQLRQTTESIGGLFDPQPSQLKGNITSLTDSSTPVLGYFSAGSYNEERIFVDYYDLPPVLQKLTLTPGCAVDSLSLEDLANLSDASIIGSAIYEGGSLVGYTISSPRCADCRTAGGVTEEPDFWE
jgi:hypothetical protein